MTISKESSGDGLFDDGFGEVARAVDVDRVLEGHEVGEELEGHDLGDGEQMFGSGCDGDAMATRAGTVVSPALARAMTRAPWLSCREELHGFFVANDGAVESGIDGGEDDEGDAIADEGVGAVFQLAGGIALGVDVGSLFELEGAFAGDGVVHSAAEVEEAGCGFVLRGEQGDLGAPGVKLGFDRIGESAKSSDVGGEGGGIHLMETGALVEGEEIEHGELAGEAFGGRDGALDAGGERHGDVGLLRHGGGSGVGDGEGAMAAAAGGAERGEGVGGFSRLRENDDAGMAALGAFAKTVFAGVFDIDGEAAEIFENDFGGEAAVAARSAGGDEDFAGGIGPGGERCGDGGIQILFLEISGEGAAEGGGLLVDLAQHFMREGVASRFAGGKSGACWFT